MTEETAERANAVPALPTLIPNSCRRLTTPQGSTWTAALRVDLGHSFFFDHPLDHVPGILIVTAIVDLLRVAAGGEDGANSRGRFGGRLDFLRFCELDEPAHLFARREPDPSVDRWSLWVDQMDAVVCQGWSAWRAGEASSDVPIPAGIEYRAAAIPAPADLVHRSRPANTMVGQPRWLPHGEVVASLLDPPSGHVLQGRDRDRCPVEHLVEAGRQFAVLLAHLAHERPRDCQFVWTRLEFDLPVAVPRAQPLVLCWRPRPSSGSRALFRFQVRGVDAAGPRLGFIAFDSAAVSRGAFRRLREAGKHA